MVPRRRDIQRGKRCFLCERRSAGHNSDRGRQFLSQSDTNNFFTGAYSTTGGTTANAAFFDGKMDEVGVWNRALSANEVSQLYNGGSGRSYQSTPGITEGSGQTEAWQTQPYGSSTSLWAGATKPAPTAGSQSMSFSYGTAMGACDEAMAALRAASAPTVYVYPQTGYMNPDAVGSIGNGISTTTYTYDANGNLIQAGGWSYVWDYLNRMLASGYNNSTTTYAYDATGARVLQTSTTSTTLLPQQVLLPCEHDRWRRLVCHVDELHLVWRYPARDNRPEALQRYRDQHRNCPLRPSRPPWIHQRRHGRQRYPGALLDYYPYGATRVATSTYPTNEKRQYVIAFKTRKQG